MKYLPSILRGLIYMLLSAILATSDSIESLTRDAVAQWNWFDWLKVALTVTGSSLLTLRAFIDSSHQRLLTDIKFSSKLPPPSLS